MIKKITHILFMLTLLTAVSSEAKVLKSHSCLSNGSVQMVIDSIDVRPDLTRVCGKIKGTPHTANRIDEIILIMPGSKQGKKANDIDGIDFKRWYQYEDAGAIYVEIDFPPVTPKNGAVMKAKCAKGDSTWTIIEKPRKKHFKK